MNRTMQVKIKKARVMGMKASKAAALGESMNELKMGTWTPYWVIVRKDGVEMYKDCTGKKEKETVRIFEERRGRKGSMILLVAYILVILVIIYVMFNWEE